MGATTKATVPLPVPEDPEGIEIQGAALSADHTQLVADAIEIDRAPPVPGVSKAFDPDGFFRWTLTLSLSTAPPHPLRTRKRPALCKLGSDKSLKKKLQSLVLGVI